MGREAWPLAAFFVVVGGLFTVMAPGGLGEPTLALGILFGIAAAMPAEKLAPLGAPKVGVLAAVLLVLGGIATILDWGLELGRFWDVVAAFGFLGGLFLLTLHVVMRRRAGREA
ncbi:hypothetical protein [Corynebacterium sp. 335C]